MKKTKNNKKPLIVKSPNSFDRNIGKLRDEKMKKIRKVLEKFMAEIREVLNRREKIGTLDGDHCLKLDERCNTCAFNPKTDSLKGFIPTAYNLAWAIGNHKLFLCHSNQKRWKMNEVDLNEVKICSGFEFVYLCHLRESYEMAQKALSAIQEIKIGK